MNMDDTIKLEKSRLFNARDAQIEKTTKVVRDYFCDEIITTMESEEKTAIDMTINFLTVIENYVSRHDEYTVAIGKTLDKIKDMLYFDREHVTDCNPFDSINWNEVYTDETLDTIASNTVYDLISRGAGTLVDSIKELEKTDRELTQFTHDMKIIGKL